MEGDQISFSSMKDIKVGRFIMIEGIPCKVVDIEISSPGKHGHAKMRVTGIGIFDGQKKTLLSPSHADIEVPLIKKSKAQVVSVSDENAQLMDTETYAVFDIKITDEFKGKLNAGGEVEIMEAMGRKALARVLS
jgi:translation initiation factor 5A